MVQYFLKKRGSVTDYTSELAPVENCFNRDIYGNRPFIYGNVPYIYGSSPDIYGK